MNKAVFLDRDGTINVEKNYLYRIEDFEFLPRSIEALKLLQNSGFKLIIITNQSGIARGYYSEADFLKLNGWMIAELAMHDVLIDKVYYCPHLPDAKDKEYRQDCECRKPRLGMFNQAIRDFNLDITQCFAIGDKLRDCSICDSTDCRGFLIGTSESQDIIDQIKSGLKHGIEYAQDLYEATQHILSNMIIN